MTQTAAQKSDHYTENLDRLYAQFKKNDSIEALLEDCKDVVRKDGQAETHAMVLLNKIVSRAIADGIPNVGHKFEVSSFSNSSNTLSSLNTFSTTADTSVVCEAKRCCERIDTSFVNDIHHDTLWSAAAIA